MREIKFRAWNKKLCKMNSVEAIDFDIEEVEVDEWDSQVLFVDAILMQYTGMVDKNGKEIYEGDILQGVYEYTEIDGTPKIIIGIGVVKFDEKLGCFIVAESNKGSNSLADWLKQKVYVIGNIYEIPKLWR